MKVGGVPTVVDLHAADVDELRAARSALRKARHRFKARGLHRPSVDIHIERTELALTPGLGQADRIEDIERDAVERRRARHLPLAGERPLGPRRAGARSCDREQRRGETNSHRPSSLARPRFVPIGVRRPSSRRRQTLHFRWHSHRRSRPSA